MKAATFLRKPLFFPTESTTPLTTAKIKKEKPTITVWGSDAPSALSNSLKLNPEKERKSNAMSSKER